MILGIIIVTMVAYANSEIYTPSKDAYALHKLIPFLNTVDMFDGPPRISNAPTTPTTNPKPTLEQMMYYNYYAVSMYCQYDLKNLSCTYCQKFKDDVNNHTVLMNNNTDTTALITLSNSRKEIVIAYCGTINIWNVVLDLDLFSTKYDETAGDIKIHKGFYRATMSLYNEVVANVGYQLSLHPNYKVVIVGHSLGGAMARVTELFLLKLNQFPGTTYEVYTYGEPRVGNKAFADFINIQNITSARVVARADIVPHVPITSIIGTKLVGDHYIHPQTEFWINGEAEKNFCGQSIYEDPTCSSSMGPAYTILDHVVYFDADYSNCIARQPGQTLAIPKSILQPIGTLPPLPKKISNIFGAAANFVMNILNPFIGR